MLQFREVLKKDNRFLGDFIRDIFIEYNAQHHKGTIFQDPTTDKLYELFQEPKSILWCAIYNEKIVGVCGIYPTKGLPSHCAELVKFYVSTELRGKGVGKKLLQRCELSALKLEYTSLYLESLPEFKNAVGMYQKYGFKYLDKPLGSSGHYGCNIWMLKKID